ncbi:hypothetical protein Bca101_000292 [Brassica carinata]
MTTKEQSRYLAAVISTVMLFTLAETYTNPLEVSALEDLHKSLNNPQQLRGWRFEGGGDPCGELWIGVYCSGSSIVALNMAYNNLTQSLLFSLPLMTSLRSLCKIPHSSSNDIDFTRDLSFNNLTGDLPSSFGTLMNLNSLIWGNKFHVEPNYKPWKFPLDVIPMIQNARGYPTTQSSAIMDFPRPQKVRKKKKGLGAVSIVLLVGGLALLGTFFAVFAVRMSHHRRSQNLAASQRSSNSTTYSLPVSTNREFSVAPPVPQLRHIPPPPVRTDKTARRNSFSATCQYPAYAKLFSAAELELATNSFSEENLLEEGPLGSVYRAKLPDGQLAAVKNIPMSSLSLHEEETFTELLQTASKLRHPNIVTLLGFCIDNGKHLLVYEYAGHLSLYNAMHDDVYKPLSWRFRLHIAIGVARALDYLHSSFSPPIAHSDLKATNILLDEELTPRIADCGLASLRPLTSNSVKLRQASEIAIQNTGYIAPEHGQPGSSGTKSDTYALGVLLLELLTGRKAFDRYTQDFHILSGCNRQAKENYLQFTPPRRTATGEMGINQTS